MCKKLTLLALAVGALVALAVPAVASADTWTANGEPVGSATATGTVFDATGYISATISLPWGVTKLGPCHVVASGKVWNPSGGTGHGEIESLTKGTPCPASVGGTQICTIEEVETGSFPWTMQVQAGTRIDIDGANFGFRFNPSCPMGEGAAISGTVTGTYSNATAGITFVGDGDMETILGMGVFLDGGIDLRRQSDGSPITLH